MESKLDAADEHAKAAQRAGGMRVKHPVHHGDLAKPVSGIVTQPSAGLDELTRLAAPAEAPRPALPKKDHEREVKHMHEMQAPRSSKPAAAAPQLSHKHHTTPQGRGLEHSKARMRT
mmetsp:Transcript_27222/g.87513  ORF Transcript_27222/g.87513 Transcript_27222/m.87513 type:complete len:117 (-) Transcript_27222:468-818(-)|eukprot:CAMPEP_0196779708 /NCGR_PEP_ID=MMETSP1104-20130614/6541_1 /TAXON_ID=33652 /ORGANISM="Cafeteria sp., Strain Caron Lab Isolate" /LENGTH=116 /DNA_ID=CAMNT_0042149891 /DNA_START=41 /DNA_END=391 /DNA_ORIENTATION=-